MDYQEPAMEIVRFSMDDIVCESNITGNEEGDGPCGSIDDLL